MNNGQPSNNGGGGTVIPPPIVIPTPQPTPTWPLWWR
jgi:hypothetical protein